MRGILSRVNTFTIFFILILLASIIQVTSLKDNVLSKVVDEVWVQTSLLMKLGNGCTGNCGTETTASNIASVSFKPERVVMASIHKDLPVVSVPLKSGTWEVYPSVANYAEG